jgi:hypothetical protein
MKLRDIVTLVNGQLLSNDVDLNIDVTYGAAADLMSDVLAFTKPNAVLLTGLINSQVIRTAEMADVAAVVFVRGKRPPADTLKLAEARGIPLVVCAYTMFEACGKLYEGGMRGSDPIPTDNLTWLEHPET